MCEHGLGTGSVWCERCRDDCRLVQEPRWCKGLQQRDLGVFMSPPHGLCTDGVGAVPARASSSSCRASRLVLAGECKADMRPRGLVSSCCGSRLAKAGLSTSFSPSLLLPSVSAGCTGCSGQDMSHAGLAGQLRLQLEAETVLRFPVYVVPFSCVFLCAPLAALAGYDPDVAW